MHVNLHIFYFMEIFRLYSKFLNPIANIKQIKNLNLPIYAVFDANIICNANLAILTDKLLHIDEKKVITRRKKATAKKEYLASRFLIKSYIAQYLSVPYDTLKLNFNERSVQLQAMYNNKPVALNISLAHSKGIIFFAITKANVEIGVDIEFQNQHRNTQALIKAYAHTSEINTLLDGEKRQFYQYWTLKEAIAKITKKTILEVLQHETRQQLSCYHHISFVYQEFALSIVQTEKIEPHCVYLIHTDKELKLNHE